MGLLHSKNYIGRLFADSGFYQINLLMKDFRFNIAGKSTTVAQKGNILEKPFHTMPSASISFNTYIKDVENQEIDLLAIFMQLGREQSSGTILVINRDHSKLLLRGDGIFDNVSIVGRAGGFIIVRVAMTFDDYKQDRDGIAQLMSL